jgi:hypothetical protein
MNLIAESVLLWLTTYRTFWGFGFVKKCNDSAGKVAKMARVWPARNHTPLATIGLRIVDCLKGAIIAKLVAIL